MAEGNRGEEAKSAGAAAWASGDWGKALQEFSRAISLASTEGASKDFLKTVYSNRSAVNAKLGKLEDALSDAKKCVELDPQWAKGHNRLGAAFYGLRNWTSAYNAYNSALRLDPNDAGSKEARDKAQNAIANANSSRSAGSSSSSSSSSSSAAAATTGGMLGKAQLFTRLALPILFIAYLLPLGAMVSMTAYRAFSFSALVSVAIQIYSEAGTPRFSTEYLQRAMTTSSGLSVMLAFVLLSSRPYMLVMVAFMLPVLAALLADYISRSLPPGARFNPEQLPSFLRSGAFAQQLPQLQATLEQLSSPGGTLRIVDTANQWAATCEIYQGIFLVVELALPTRNLMLIYLWWQYLLMRFTMEKASGAHPPVVKLALTEVDAVVTRYLSFNFVPQAVRGAYAQLKGIITAQADQMAAGGRGAAAGGGGGMMGRLAKSCSVM